MGLDILEFAMDVEKAFGISVPDADFNELATPRELVGYLVLRLQSRGTEWSSEKVTAVLEQLLGTLKRSPPVSLDMKFRDIFP